MTLNGSTVTGGVAVLDKPRHVLLTYGNEGSARTMVLTGTNWQGGVISETLAIPSGAGGTVASVLDYANVTSALPLGGGWTAAVTLGTNGVAASPWIGLDTWTYGNVRGEVSISGTVNYTIQTTNDDPNSPTNPVTPALMAWDSAFTAVVSQTTEAAFGIAYTPAWIRVLLNSGSGSVTLNVMQHSSSSH